MNEEKLGKTVSHIGANIEKRKYAFIFCLIAVFFVLFTILHALDFVPEARDTASAAETGTKAPVQVVATTTISVTTAEGATPVRIVASTIGLDAKILNPASRSVAVLDESLLSGAVRYPGSAEMDDDGTMFVFGHSSNLPIVHNQNFKVFNNIKNLKDGDLIHVESKDLGNVYRVISVSQAPAEEIKVEFTGHGKRLILSTCNSFGGKDSRYVVEAIFVGSYPLSNNP